MSPQFTSIDSEKAPQQAVSPPLGEFTATRVDSPVSSPVSTYLSPTARIASNNETRIPLEEPGRSLNDGKPKSPARAWLVLLGAWCASFCSFGWINSAGIFQEYYASGPLHDYSASQIAWIPALQIFSMYFLGPVFGCLFDMYGPRWLLLFGSLAHVFGLLMASLSTKYYQILLSQGVCSAFGVAAVFLASIGCVSGWFDKHRGTAFGILATGSSVGGVVFPILITNLIEKANYGWAMRTGALVIAAMLAVTNLAVRRNGDITPQMDLSSAMLKKPFSEGPFVILLAGLALVPFGLYTPINYLPTLAIQAGMDTGLAQNLVSAYNGASLFGRVCSGILADRLGRFNLFIASCYVAGVLVVAMWIPGTETAATFAFAAMFGLFSGAYIALVSALVAEISPIGEIGYRNGISSLAQSVGGLASTPIAGVILQQANGVVWVKVYAGSFLIVGTTGVLVAWLVKTNFRLKMVD